MMDYFIAFMIIVVAIFIWDWFEKPKQANENTVAKKKKLPWQNFWKNGKKSMNFSWLQKQKCEKFQENKRTV